MTNVEKLVIAGLLHDIGKVVRRSNQQKEDHTMQGFHFLQNEEMQMEDKEEILEMVKNHHAKYLEASNLKEDNLSYLLYEADNIASGIDRRKLDGGMRGDEMLALHSVFQTLHKEKDPDRMPYFVKPKPIKEDEIRIPIKNETYENTTMTDYYAIQDENLRAHLKKLALDSTTIHSLLGLLEATTSCIPSSSYVDRPDIPLYDHSKLTAAIAANYFLYLQNKNEKNYKKQCFDQPDPLREEKTMLFVSAEFSGIQNFIYSIASFNAMKSLRGRSFYLELLTEHVIDEILEESEVYRTNLIYSGASSFYLLLPNTPKTQKALELAQEKINDFLLKNYSVELYFAISYTPCSAEDLANGLKEGKKSINLLGNLFRENADKISELKRQKYTVNQLENLFDPDSSMNKLEDYARECGICRSSKKLKIFPEMGDKELCQDCRNFIELGKQLARRSPEIVEGKGKSQDPDYYFVQTSDKEENGLVIEMPSLQSEGKRICLLDAEQTLKWIQEDKKTRIYSVNRKMVGKRVTANLWVGDYNTASQKEEAGLIEFDELASRCRGITRLAVLRADIDDLGAAFAYGFQDKTSEEHRYRDISISRIATFSRLLSEFFKKNINGIAARSYQIEGYSWFSLLPRGSDFQELVIVYSGGDDVFVIGTWSNVIEFAIDLRQVFKLYTANRLEFSAGIGFFKNKYPVSQMAIKAGELENRAKDLPGKAGIALFGLDPLEQENHVYKWDVFIHQVLEEKYKSLKTWFYFDEKEKETTKLLGSTALLYRLMELARTNLRKEKKTVDFARLVYTLSRINYAGEKDPLYLEMRSKIIQWFLKEEDLKQFLTALQILIYEIRE